MTEHQTQANLKSVSIDELFDDVIGLSFKTFRSIGLLFKRPVEYFQAAKSPFWQNRLTPSFRIFLGLTALSTSFRYFYQDPNSPMVKLYARAYEPFKNDPPEGLTADMIDPTQLAVATLKWYVLLNPIFITILFCLLGLLFRAFGEKLNPIVRIRYIFATIVPASFIGLISVIPMAFLAPKYLGVTSNVGLLLMVIAMWVTCYRGAFSAVSDKSGRIGRATALSVSLFFMIMIAAFLSIFIGAIIVGIGLAKAGGV